VVIVGVTRGGSFRGDQSLISTPHDKDTTELRQYFLYLKNVKHYSRNTMTVAICGIRFFTGS